MESVNSLKWYCLSKSLGFSNGFFELFRYSLISRFFNLVLPSNLGGDALRIRLQGKSSGNYSLAAATIFIERLTGIITLIVLSSCLMLFYGERPGFSYVFFTIAFMVLGLVLLLWCIFDFRLFCFFQKLVHNRSVFLTNLAKRIVNLREEILFVCQKKQAIVVAFLNSVLFYSVAIINGWLAVRAFDINVSLSDMFVAIPLILILLNMPISIGNVGLLEFSYVLVLGVFGLPPAVGLSVALLMRAKTFFSAGIGYVIYNIDLARGASVSRFSQNSLQVDEST